MPTSSSFKQDFLKNMLIGIKLSGVFNNVMSFQERKRAIRLSANAAMALARGHTYWSRAIVTKLSKQETDKAFVKSILGKEYKRFTEPCKFSWQISRSKVLRRNNTMQFRQRKRLPSNVIARRMVKKRAQVLKRLIPGGEFLYGSYLLDETLDYAIYLRAQVELMEGLTESLGAPPNSNKSVN